MQAETTNLVAPDFLALTAERPEIGEYRTLIAEIENEIDRLLKEAGPED